MQSRKFFVNSKRTQYNERTESLLSVVDYHTTRVEASPGGHYVATPTVESLTFRTKCRVPRVGCMLIGWGGNSGSTVTASVLANRHNMIWRTKEGMKVSRVHARSCMQKRFERARGLRTSIRTRDVLL